MSMFNVISKVLENEITKQLNKERYSILKILLDSANFYLPFSFDADKKNVYGMNKVLLAKSLSDGDWKVTYGSIFISGNEVYTIKITFNQKKDKRLFFEDSSTDDSLNECSSLQFYILYEDFLRIYREVPNNRGDYWKYALKPEDYNVKKLPIMDTRVIGGVLDGKA